LTKLSQYLGFFGGVFFLGKTGQTVASDPKSSYDYIAFIHISSSICLIVEKAFSALAFTQSLGI